MKVDNPEFHAATGEAASCEQCPLDNQFDGPQFDSPKCKKWWYRNGDTDSTILVCPTSEDYEAACKLAEDCDSEDKPSE